MIKSGKPVKTVDRRIQKTKKLLSDALVSLIIDKGYASVTIKNIIDKANVGRSTFYSHFEDKEQLLLSGHDTFERLLTESVQTTGNGNSGAGINFLFLYRHLQEQSSLTRALMKKKGGDVVQNHVHNIFVRRIEEYFVKKDGGDTDRMLLSLKTEAAASAMVTLMMQWMEKGMPYTPEEMALQCESLLSKMMS